MEFLDVVRTRRSSRRFLPRPVPDEVLTEILDAGRLAPTAGNQQRFFFGVVRGETTKQELAAAANQEWVATAPVLIAHCVRLCADPATVPADDFGLRVNRHRFGDNLINYLNAYPDRRAMRIFWDNATPHLPGQQVFLAAVNRGLAACWVGYLDIRRASEILHLPDDMACLYLMPIGYAAEPPGDKSLRSIEDCVFYESWPAG